VAVRITCGVIVATVLKSVVAGKAYLLTWRTQLTGQTSEEQILSGTYECVIGFEKDYQLPISIDWVLTTAWEVLALCLSVWIAVKHFRDLRRLCASTGSITEDCFGVLIKSHVLYFARWTCNVDVVIFSPLILHALALSVSLASSLLISLHCFRCASLSLTRLIVTTAHHFCRLQILQELWYSSVIFNCSSACRCLCWDHASSLAFENIPQNSLPTPMQKSAWLRLSSRNVCMY
jgi:hypothetical protein